MRVRGALDNKGGSADGRARSRVMSDYLKAGGRIFTTDFMYTWYRYAGDAELQVRRLVARRSAPRRHRR